MLTIEVIEMMMNEIGTEQFNLLEIDDFSVIDEYAMSKGFIYDDQLDMYFPS